MWKWIKWLWSRIGDVLVAQQLAVIVGGTTLGATVLGPLAAWAFTPASPFDLAIVAIICGAAAFAVAYRFAPKHIHHHSATVMLRGVEAKAGVGSFVAPPPADPRGAEIARFIDGKVRKINDDMLSGASAGIRQNVQESQPIPLREASRVAYEQLRGTQIALAAERFGKTPDRILVYLANGIFAYHPVTAERAPSTIQEIIPESSRATMEVTEDCDGIKEIIGADEPIYIHPTVSQVDLAAFISSMKEGR